MAALRNATVGMHRTMGHSKHCPGLPSSGREAAANRGFDPWIFNEKVTVLEVNNYPWSPPT